MQTINERIKHLRIDLLNLSQSKFADDINLKRNSISQIEIGRRNPSERTLKDISEKYNVNYFWLKNGIGEVFLDYKKNIIDELVEEYNLDDLDRQIIEQYLTLGPKQREALKAYIRGMGENGK